LGLEGAIAGPLGPAAAGAAEKGTAGTVAKTAGEAVSGPLVAPILDRAALLRLNAELGRVGEEAVGIPAHAPKPGIKVLESGITRYPDRLTRRTIEEVKNVQYLALTRQLRDYLTHAENNDLNFILRVRPETKYSGPLRSLIDADRIKFKYIPGPSR
jgi:Restriction endonuclease fold toxin 7